MNAAHDFPALILQDLSPAAVEDYLMVSGWRRTEHREGLFSIWESDEADASVMLPYNTAYRDYSARLNDALTTIAEVCRIDSGEALTLEIAAARNDILLLRLDQPVPDGSIPLHEAAHRAGELTASDGALSGEA
ncbi:hypothetical protein [Rhizohabitans arisaemae]|uniref:hypothetical protein n=1 Tax=Rhizohabitans arisaemae TaxID=2720610 RepID=UPI0024B0BD08|nr:hypothetical protein [Rhizohabitans arisaemae]